MESIVVNRRRLLVFASNMADWSRALGPLVRRPRRSAACRRRRRAGRGSQRPDPARGGEAASRRPGPDGAWRRGERRGGSGGGRRGAARAQRGPPGGGVGAAGTVAGRLERSGPGWWLLSAAGGVDQLVSTDAMTWVSGLPALAADPAAQSAVEGRLGLPYALRGIARDRSPVGVVLRDGTTCAGTIDRVGADFLDLAEHAPGEPRRAGVVRSARTIALASVAVVRSG